jgi:hypothetical protein
MEAVPIISKARQELAEAVSSVPISTPSPIKCSPWIAMSLLQKATRRGREDLALRAAATLLRDSPERLWRRCGVIAFEDVGVADLATAGMVVAALGGKTFRARLGGEWPVASTIVSAMSRAPKCRSADDLLMIIERHPGLKEERSAYAKYSTRELVRIATGNDPLCKRALALRFAVGTSRRPSAICDLASASRTQFSTICSTRDFQPALSRLLAKGISGSASRSATFCRYSAPSSHRLRASTQTTRFRRSG